MLDQERCYRAVASRDARFDGLFITAVRTTGIYCRPSCPATTPKRANVEFLPTTGAAQLRGYRACRRCRPDAVPGSPEWNSRADLAGRAMRLIADGVVERDGVGGLAVRLGYSERHLNRVLTAELGAGPLALARAHRAHTARLLIETTALQMADIAFAAGFASVRQFNDTVREVYGVAPTTLRAEAGRRRDATQAAAGSIILRLPYRTPFDAAGLLDFFAARALDRVESVEDGTYRRTLRLPHGPATVALTPISTNGRSADAPRGTDARSADAPRGTHIVAALRLADPRDLGPAVARLRRLFDLDSDPVAVDEVLAADPALAQAVRAVPGIRLPGTVDGVEQALRAMLGQQVSVAAARTTSSRLAAALGEHLPSGLAGDGLDLLFPTAEAIAEHGAEILTGPARRTAAVLGLATALADGTLVLDAARDPDELHAALTALPGIGPWTAGYLAMRLLGMPDELLPSDIAIRRGARALGIPSDVDELTRYAQRWRPWRSYAATHLWRAAAGTPRNRRTDP
ncbi:AlkA N-terminal domain-containing protein [Pseudonocardia asaccharolytica]|uniref:DNA-3-methyladenine glycosylase II n=1 Tax=Pseudonocardia asaccharolytica DSM 44247 = NBRC 16224 TaxID=1123024 RepID=A0A511D165_9PSEU|nr:AlkA N-terminal domain-containing protein [Pseudonocardia asaccharolytica]GEL18542.1 DNA-3-methyladenine glycosylase [Pseudonocardia asaccharolytica DSM 44247 = NBRC 16224]